MKTVLLRSSLLSLLASVAFAGIASAQTAPAPAPEDPGHPRINQIDKRIDRQDAAIQNAEQSGKITQAQATRDLNRNQRIQNRMNKDEAAHGGHITKAEQRHLNKKLNGTNHMKKHQKQRDHKAAAR